MPSPVGHALGGMIAGLVVAFRLPTDSRLSAAAHGQPRAMADEPTPDSRPRALVIACALSAVAPDLDFLWGRHNMETHSLGAALMAGAAAFAIGRGRNRRLAVAVALAWASHVLFDWLGSDTTPPLGVMALWPFSSDYYFANAFVFEAISRRHWLPGFWRHNLTAVALELLYLGPWVALVAFLRRGRAAPDRS